MYLAKIAVLLNVYFYWQSEGAPKLTRIAP
jgi:hypothetical protein